MEKSILVIDTPIHCLGCPIIGMNRHGFFVCNGVSNENKLTNDNLIVKKPNWCPLKSTFKLRQLCLKCENYNGEFCIKDKCVVDERVEKWISSL